MLKGTKSKEGPCGLPPRLPGQALGERSAGSFAAALPTLLFSPLAPSLGPFSRVAVSLCFGACQSCERARLPCHACIVCFNLLAVATSLKNTRASAHVAAKMFAIIPCSPRSRFSPVPPAPTTRCYPNVFCAGEYLPYFSSPKNGCNLEACFVNFSRGSKCEKIFLNELRLL